MNEFSLLRWWPKWLAATKTRISQYDMDVLSIKTNFSSNSATSIQRKSLEPLPKWFFCLWFTSLAFYLNIVMKHSHGMHVFDLIFDFFRSFKQLNSSLYSHWAVYDSIAADCQHLQSVHAVQNNNKLVSTRQGLKDSDQLTLWYDCSIALSHGYSDVTQMCNHWCWWQKHYVGEIALCHSCHQHISSPISVTNINVALSHVLASFILENLSYCK